MVNVGSAPGAAGRWWRSARRDVRCRAGGVAEPPYYSEAGKAGHMGKGGSRTVACEAVREVGREYARAV